MTTKTIITNRRERLEKALDLAQAYRGWSRKELATELGRDATKLIPESGNPKFDMILRLAEVLDWTLDEVSDWVWYGNNKTKSNDKVSIKTTFVDLDGKAQEAHRIGEYKKMVAIAHSALDIAKSPEERMHVNQMLKICKEEFDRLMETSPTINDIIIDLFKHTFTSNKNGHLLSDKKQQLYINFAEINKPEI
ncbi:MAG: helix-turn-helix domain-containing protein, partial [Phycisphaerae bacterium]|nr:helix-turn-helix domain-containing protein [Phycisphaerae bacterium]